MTIKTTTHLTPDRAFTLHRSPFVAGLATALPWILCIALALVVGLLIGRSAQPATAPLQPVIAPPPIIMIATAQPTQALPTPQPAVALDQVQPTAAAPAPSATPEPDTVYVADVQPTSAPTDAPIVNEVRTVVAANPQATVQIVKDANPCQSDDPVVRASCEVFK